MNDIKNGWNNIDELVGIPGYGITSVDRFIGGRSASIYRKMHGIFVRDFIFKSVSCLFIVLNLFVYSDYEIVLIINLILLFLLGFFTFTQIRYFKMFKRSADPGQSSKENLTSIFAFIKRRFPMSALVSATSYLFGFVPGMLLFFFLANENLNVLQPTAYFVYSFICLSGMIYSYVLDMRQAKYHSKHIEICLSDLNDNALAMASENIELKRKRDTTVIILTQVLILLSFFFLVSILKSIVT